MTVLALTLFLGLLSTARFTSRTPLSIPLAHATTGIEFFNFGVGGDDFVWCFDRSCSMGQGPGPGLDDVKDQIIDALQQLSPANQFSLVRFSDSYYPYAWTLLSASPDNVADATAWLNSTQPDGGTTDLVEATILAIELAGYSQGSSSVFLIGDGDQQVFVDEAAEISANNPDQIPVHCFHLGSTLGLSTFEQIAAATGGMMVDTALPLSNFRRGDLTVNGTVDLGDVICLLEYGFLGSGVTLICEDAADINDDGMIEPIVDAVALLQALFVPGATPISAPGLVCGIDPTTDSLTCDGACP